MSRPLQRVLASAQRGSRPITVLFDGTGIIYHAWKGVRAAQGEPRSAAVRHFADTMLRLVRTLSSSHWAFVLDRRSKRKHAIYDGYKGRRAAVVAPPAAGVGSSAVASAAAAAAAAAAASTPPVLVSPTQVQLAEQAAVTYVPVQASVAGAGAGTAAVRKPKFRSQPAPKLNDPNEPVGGDVWLSRRAEVSCRV
jgi:hypothetical protein